MAEYKDIGLYTGKSGFEGAIGKIGRAHFDLKDLNQRLRTFTKTYPHRISEDFNLRPGEEIGDYTFTIRKPTPPNREWGVLVGEIAHHLRSALDHAAFAAADIKASKTTQFPVCQDEEDWDKWACGMIYGIPEKPLAIIKKAQPYQAGAMKGTHALTLLHAMWNHDKHRLLHTTRIVLGKPYPAVVKVQDVAEIIKTKFIFRAHEENTEVVRVTIKPSGSNPKLKLDGELRAGVAFAEGIAGAGAIKGLHVEAVLTNVLLYVRDVVGYMDAACRKA